MVCIPQLTDWIHRIQWPVSVPVPLNGWPTLGKAERLIVKE